MGIKLDWEVESEGGWNEVGEDGQAAEQRKRCLRRIRNILIGVLFLAVLTAGGVAWRLQQVGRQLEADLEATVAAETLALRIGDREGFIAVQSGLGGWQRAQERTFDEYQALAPLLEVPGEVLEMEVEAQRAEVALREMVDGQPYRVRWFYEHTDQGWRHVPAPVESWGEQSELEADHFSVVYHLADDTFAQSVVARLSDWWATACLLTRCEDSGEPPRFEVRIGPDPLAEIGWASYDEDTLIVPSPLLGRVPEGEAADPALWRTLARLFAERWLGPSPDRSPELAPDEEWANQELAAWLAYELDNSLPPSTVFGPLTEVYGLNVVPDFRAALGRGEEVLPALQSVTNTPLADLPVEWGTFFAHRLRAEVLLIDSNHRTEARLIYRDPERDPDVGAADVPTETLARPASITVLSTRTYGEVVWAEVRFLDDATGEPLIAYEPFRIVGDRWAHTMPAARDWGSGHSEEGEYLRLGYYELDAAHVEGLLPQLEGVYSQVAADLGLAPEALSVEVVLTPTGRVDPLTRAEGGLSVGVRSPYGAIRPADTSAPGYVALASTHALVENLVARQTTPFPINHPLAYAFVSLEMERTGLPTDARMLPFVLDEPIGVEAPPSLESLWSGRAANMTYSAADYLAARLLLDMLVEAYGPEAIPDLLARLPDSANVDDWLTRSLGIESGALEADWRARLETALQE